MNDPGLGATPPPGGDLPDDERVRRALDVLSAAGDAAAVAGIDELRRDWSLLHYRCRRLEEAVRHYADLGNWINRCEYKPFPGFHGSAVAALALRKATTTDARNQPEPEGRRP